MDNVENCIKQLPDYFVSYMYLKMMSTMLIKLISEAPTISGMFCVMDACSTQKVLPATEITSIYIDTSSVRLVLIALNICGTRISVQRNEAAHPNKTSNGILILKPIAMIDVCAQVVFCQRD